MVCSGGESGSSLDGKRAAEQRSDDGPDDAERRDLLSKNGFSFHSVRRENGLVSGTREEPFYTLGRRCQAPDAWEWGVSVKLRKFWKPQFVNLARVAPPALRRRPQFWGECPGIVHFA